MLIGPLVMGQLHCPHVIVSLKKKLSFPLKAEDDLNDFNVLYLKILLWSPLLDFAQPILYILRPNSFLSR
jgi:hypothetical protein